LPADTTWVTLSVTLPGVQATAGAVGSSGTTPSPASSTRCQRSGWTRLTDARGRELGNHDSGTRKATGPQI
jgi:hypothetical protein